MSKGFSLGTGEIVCFGGANPNSDMPYQVISFPENMGPVNVMKVCSNQVVLLDKGLTCRFGDAKDEHDNAFEALADIEMEFVDVVRSGSGHFLALTAGGSVYSWGANQNGQLGLGHTRDVDTPTLVKKFNDINDRVTRIVVGHAFSAALTSNGDVYTWGDGASGQCAGRQNCLVPRYVSHLQRERVMDITCGHSFVAARTLHGDVYTWGSGLFKKRQNVPTPLEPFNNNAAKANTVNASANVIIDMAAGFSHLMLITATHNLYSVGSGLYGQLGLGDNVMNQTSPAKVPGFEQELDAESDGVPVSVFCGDFYTAIITSTGAVFTCGKNKFNRLGINVNSDISFPTKITSLGDRKISQIGCGSEFMTVFIPTFLTAVTPSVLSAAGGTDVVIQGFGLYETNMTVAVNFFFNNKNFTVEGEYKADVDQVVTVSPQLLSSEQDIEGPPEACAISVSMDGRRYTNALPVHVYRDPDIASAQPLVPAHGSFVGGTPVEIAANFDSIPYGNIEVCFLYNVPDDSVQDKENMETKNTISKTSSLTDLQTDHTTVTRIVKGTYDASKRLIRCETPAFPQDQVPGNSAIAQVHVSLDGQRSFYLGQNYTFYNVQSLGTPLPSLLSYDGGVVLVTCSGLLYVDQCWVAFHVNGFQDEFRTFKCPARQVTALDLSELLWTNFASDGGPGGFIQRSISAADVCNWIQNVSVFPSLKTATIESLLQTMQLENTAQSLGKQQLKQALEYCLAYHNTSSLGKDYVRTLRVQSPSFIDFGACQVNLSVTLNGLDYTPLQAMIDVQSSQLVSMVPNCAPINSNTLVRLQGSLLYPSRNIIVRMTPSVAFVPVAVKPGEEGEEDEVKPRPRSSKRSKGRSSRGNLLEDEDGSEQKSKITYKLSDCLKNGGILSKQYTCDFEATFQTELVVPGPLQAYEITQSRVSTAVEKPTSSIPSTPQTVVPFARQDQGEITLPPHLVFNAEKKEVLEGVYALSVAMDPSHNAFSTVTLPFTFYKTPVIKELSSSPAALEGGTEFTLTSATGFFDSQFILVRLQLVEDDVRSLKEKEAKEREKKVKDASDKRKRERADKEKKTRASHKSKKHSKKHSSHDADKPSTPVHDDDTNDAVMLETLEVPDRPSRIVTIPASFHGGAVVSPSEGKNAVVESRKRDDKSKKKSRKGKSKQVETEPEDNLNMYDEGSFVTFISPPASEFGHYGAEGLCQVRVEIALNGQSFVDTGKTFKFDVARQGKKSKKPRAERE